MQITVWYCLIHQLLNFLDTPVQFIISNFIKFDSFWHLKLIKINFHFKFFLSCFLIYLFPVSTWLFLFQFLQCFIIIVPCSLFVCHSLQQTVNFTIFIYWIRRIFKRIGKRIISKWFIIYLSRLCSMLFHMIKFLLLFFNTK